MPANRSYYDIEVWQKWHATTELTSSTDCYYYFYTNYKLSRSLLLLLLLLADLNANFLLESHEVVVF